jgi:hypothetical protein
MGAVVALRALALWGLIEARRAPRRVGVVPNGAKALSTRLFIKPMANPAAPQYRRLLVRSPEVLAAVAVSCVLMQVPAAAAGRAEIMFRFADPAIAESSGLASSVVHPDIVWTHNDSGSTPQIFAVDTSTGETVAVVTLRDVLPLDVEAIAMGRDETGLPALFVSDTGTSVPLTGNAVIHRFTEPAQLVDQPVDVTTYRIDFGGIPRPDVEALLVDPRDNRVHLVSKDPLRGTVFQGPPTLSSDAANAFTAVGPAPAAISDGTFLPDGRVAVRSNRTARILEGVGGRVLDSIALPAMRAGESITLTPDGAFLLIGSEGMHSPIWRIPLETQASAPSPAPVPSAMTPSSPPSPPATPAPVETEQPSAGSSSRVGHGVQAGVVISAIVAVGLLILGIRRRSMW